MNSLTSAPTMAPASGGMSTAGILVIAIPCILVLAIVAIVVSSIIQKKNTNLPSTEGSCFDGNFWQRLGWTIVARFLTVITLGLAYPAAVCMLLRWECKHTVINGRRLKFTGTGAQLFGKYILWWLLTIVTFGIFGIWLGLNMKKWTVKHTVYADDHTCAASRFTGGVGGYIGIRLLAGLLTVCTFGIGTAWGKRMIINWEINHTYISGTHLGFTGKGGQLFGKYILWGFLTVITFSIFSLFIPIKFLKWQYKHVGATPVEEVPGEKKTGIGVIIAVIGAGLAVLLIAGAVVALFLPHASISSKDELPANNTEQTMFILNDAGMLVPTLADAQQLIGNYESCVDYDEIQGQAFSFALDSALSPEEGRDDSWTQEYFAASGTIGTTAYLDTEQDILYLDYGVESAGCPTYLCLDGDQTGTGHAAPLTKLIHAGNGIHSVAYPYDEAPEYIYVMALAHITDTSDTDDGEYYFVTLCRQNLDVTVSASGDPELNDPADDLLENPEQTDSHVNTGTLIGNWVGRFTTSSEGGTSDDAGFPYPDITCLHWQLNHDGTFTSYTMAYINVGGGFSEMYNPVKHLGTWAVEGNTLTLRTEVIDYPAEEPSKNTDETETYTVYLENGNLILENHPNCSTMLQDADIMDVYFYGTEDTSTQSGTLTGTWVILGAPEKNTVDGAAETHFADGGWYDFRSDGTFALNTRTIAAQSGSWFDLGGGEKFYEGTYTQDGNIVTLHYTTTYKSVWNDATQCVESQPVAIDETDQLDISLTCEGFNAAAFEHPRFGSVCLFKPTDESPIDVILGFLAFQY